MKSVSKGKLRKIFSPIIYTDKIPVANLILKVTAKSRRSAIAKALSVAMLLRLPACTSANKSCGWLIADIGCGKDMVSESTFTQEFVSDNSV